MDDPDLFYNVLGSASAGIISRICTHPLDTCKARIQAPSISSSQVSSSPPLGNKYQYKGVTDALMHTFRQDGIRGLYRGFGAILVGGTPGTILYLCSYEYFKNKLKQNEADGGDSMFREFGIYFTSGLLAETVCCVIYVPVDVIKERLQVQSLTTTSSGNRYNGSLDAFRKILKVEGLSGIYKGYWATLASFGPFSAFYFTSYEKLKSIAKNNERLHDKNETDLPFPVIVACSSFAGALSSWLTSPLDMAKLRLQIQRGSAAATASESPTTIKYKNMAQCLHHTYKYEGMKGLFRGAGARVFHFVPATTITMSCYEKCKSYFKTTF